MNDFETASLNDKAEIAAQQIQKNSQDSNLRLLAFRLKTPERTLRWIKNNVRYVREGKETLNSMMHTIRFGGDCEEMTILMGSLANIQGYSVAIRIISNGTNHIFPLVKVRGRWKSFDPIPKKGIPKGYIKKEYHTVVQGILPASGQYQKVATGRLSGIDNGADNENGFVETIKNNIPIGLGIGLGTAVSALIFRKFVKDQVKKWTK